MRVRSVTSKTPLLNQAKMGHWSFADPSHGGKNGFAFCVLTRTRARFHLPLLNRPAERRIPLPGAINGVEQVPSPEGSVPRHCAQYATVGFRTDGAGTPCRQPTGDRPPIAKIRGP